MKTKLNPILLFLIVSFSASGQTFIENPTYVENGNEFGKSVALSPDGSTLAIGAPRAGYETLGTYTGMVRIYRRNSKDALEWSTLGQDILGSWSSLFGASISISDDGSRIAIGAPEAEGCQMDDSGAIFVFQYNEVSGLWEELPVDVCSVASNRLQTGTSVDMTADGNRMVVGSFRSLVNGNNIGSADIYNYDPATHSFAYTASLDPIGILQDGMSFGSTVRITSDGSVIVVGAPSYHSFPDVSLGRVYAYTTNNDWDYMDAGYRTGEMNNHKLGASMDIEVVNGSPTLVLGSFEYSQLEIYDGIGDPFWSGQTPVYLFGPPVSFFGESVAMNSSGDIIVGLTPLGFIPPATGQGYFYEWVSPGSWQQSEIIDPLGSYPAESMGEAVSISSRIFTGGGVITVLGAPLFTGFGPPSNETHQPYVRVELVNEPCCISLPSNSITAESIRIYPNPSKGRITIESQLNFDKIVVVNGSDEIVQENDVPGLRSNEFAIDLMPNVPGVFYLKLYEGFREVATRRIILE